MKPNEKRTQNLYKTLYYSGNVEEEFENIMKECERKMAKYTDPNNILLIFLIIFHLKE